MTPSHRSSVLIYCLLLILILLVAGCATTKTQQFRNSFLPPLPKTDPAVDLIPAEPPTINPRLYASETPNVIPVELPIAGSTEVESRLKRADSYFDAGKKVYAAGNVDEARSDFNRAVDVLLSTPDSTVDRSRVERRLDQMVEDIYRYDVNGLGSGEDADKVVYDKSPLDGMLEMTFPIDPRLKPKVMDEVKATASQLPLEENDSVLSYIHFFETDRGRKVLTAGLRRAGRYRPLIQRVLDEEGVPAELMYLAQAESGFLPRAVSNKSATGMWQFVRFRGQQYGLDQTSYTDDRLDPEKATRAAAHHLHDLFNEFGDWYLAMAAYNCGPGCVEKAVQRTGYADFWMLRNLNVLPHETQNYVPLILAITIMSKNPKDYGLDGIELDPALDYESVKLEAPTNLALIADACERPISEIRDLNPSLLRGIAPSGYDLRVPKGAAKTLTAALDTVPAGKRASWRIHHVERGETLADIARQFRMAPAAIAAANNRVSAAPEAGDVLIIPAAYQEKTPVARSTRSGRRSRSGATAAQSRTTPKVSMRAASYSKRVPAKVLHHRAEAHVKTAALNTSHHAE